MATIEQLADAALRRENLQLRALAQELLHKSPCVTGWPRPATDDPRMLAAAASIAELLASRLQQSPPPWAREVEALQEPIFLLNYAATMPRLRALCLQESPEPLRKRGFYAPPNFLEFV